MLTRHRLSSHVSTIVNAATLTAVEQLRNLPHSSSSPEGTRSPTHLAYHLSHPRPSPLLSRAAVGVQVEVCLGLASLGVCMHAGRRATEGKEAR